MGDFGAAPVDFHGYATARLKHILLEQSKVPAALPSRRNFFLKKALDSIIRIT